MSVISQLGIAVIAIIIAAGGVVGYTKLHDASQKNPLSVTSSKSTSTIVPDVRTADWQIYKSNEMGFEVKYPQGWKAESYPHQVLFSPIDKSQYSSSYWIMFDRADSLIVKTYGDDLEKYFPLNQGQSIESKNDMVIDGKKSLEIKIISTIPSAGIKSLVGPYVVIKGSSYAFKATSGLSLWQSKGSETREDPQVQEKLDIFNQMISTFKTI